MIQNNRKNWDHSIDAQNHGNIPHTAHGSLVRKQHGFYHLSQRSEEPFGLQNSVVRVHKYNEPKHNKIPYFTGDQQRKQIMLIKMSDFTRRLHGFMQQQRAAYHQKQRHANSAEY